MQNLTNTLEKNRLMPFTVGFDELFDKLYSLESNSVGFPPYNIKKLDDFNYQIDMALAGYSKKEINIEVSEGELTVSSDKQNTDRNINSSVIHKGISEKNFVRKFTLSDEIFVKSAEMKDGMLSIKLERIIPDHRKPKQITIK